MPERPPVCPYPGLRPFNERTAHLFFGRSQQRDECIRRLEDQRFLALVGMSGAGKSSLVLAGIVPVLRMGMLSWTEKPWIVVRMRPGSRPLGALARALANSFAPPGTSAAAIETTLRPAIEATLRRSSRGLLDAVAERSSRDRSVLLVVDQFEELFRLGKDQSTAARRAEQANFVQLLLAPRSQSHLPVCVVITMRSAYLGHCAKFHDLPEALNDGQFLVPRLSRAQLQEAIESPAETVGLRLSHALVQRVLNDATSMADELPVVQHALMRTFQVWRRKVEARREWHQELTVDHYEEAGTVASALSLHGEQTLGTLGPNECRAAEVLFRRITMTGGAPEGDEFSADAATRDPAPMGALRRLVRDENLPDPIRSLDRAIEAFRDPGESAAKGEAREGEDSDGASRFLMPPSETPSHGRSNEDGEEIDITHEAILRRWGTLTEWISVEQSDAEKYRKLSTFARSLGLLRGQDLKPFREWWNERKPSAEWARRYHVPNDEFPEAAEAPAGETEAAVREREKQHRDAIERWHAAEFARTRDYLERSVRSQRSRMLAIRLFGATTAALVVCATAYAVERSFSHATESQARLDQFVAAAKAKSPIHQLVQAWATLHDSEKRDGKAQAALNDYYAERLQIIEARARESLDHGCSEEAAVLYGYGLAAGNPSDAFPNAPEILRLFDDVLATAPLKAGRNVGACLRTATAPCEHVQLSPGGALLASCGGDVGQWTVAGFSAGAKLRMAAAREPAVTEGPSDTKFAAVETSSGPLLLRAQGAHPVSPAGDARLLAQLGVTTDAGSGRVPACRRPYGMAVVAQEPPPAIRLALACDGTKALAIRIDDPARWIASLNSATTDAPSVEAFPSSRVTTISRSLQHINDVAWLGDEVALAMSDGLALSSPARPDAMRYVDALRGSVVFRVQAFSDPAAREIAYGTLQTESAPARVGVLDSRGESPSPPIDLGRSRLKNYRVASVTGAKNPGDLVALTAGDDTSGEIREALLIRRGQAVPLPIAAPGGTERIGDVAAASTPDALLVAVSLSGRIRVFSYRREASSGDGGAAAVAPTWKRIQQATSLTINEDTLQVEQRDADVTASVPSWQERFPGWTPPKRPDEKSPEDAAPARR
jgi:hypothetical protein